MKRGCNGADSDSQDALLTRFIERNLREIRRIASGLVGNWSFARAEDIEDLAQDAVLRMFEIMERKSISFDNDHAFLAWTRQILKLVMREYAAKNKRQISHISIDDNLSYGSNQVLENLHRIVLDEIFSRLPTQYRLPLEYHLTGFTDEEISALLGLTRDNIRQRRSRAISMIRKLLCSTAPFSESSSPPHPK